MEPEPLPLPVELPEDGRLYQHFRGDCFRVICCALSSEDGTTYNVVYRSLSTGRIWTRSYAKFTEVVLWRDGVRRARYMPVAGLPPELAVRRCANDVGLAVQE